MTHTGIKESLAEFRQRVGRKQAKKRDTKRRFEKKKEKARTIIKDRTAPTTRRTTRSARDLVLEKARTPFTEQELASQRAEAEKAAGGRFAKDKPGFIDKIKSGVGQIFEETIGETGQQRIKNSGQLTIPLSSLVIGGVGVASITTTAVKEAAKVGTKGFSIGFSPPGAGVAGATPTNTKTIEATTNWLTKLFTSKKTLSSLNPETGKTTTRIITTTITLKAALITGTIAASVGLLIASIGSYPFAGFLKEEALQTLGFGVRSAVINEDFEGAEEALELQKNILDPGVWNEIKAGIPYINVLSSLDDFYEAARIKVSIDEQVIKDLKIKVETGESDTEMYARIAVEKAEAERTAIDYYNEESLITQQSRIEADRLAHIAKTDRERKAAEANVKLWADATKTNIARAAAEREAAAEFWLAYNKTLLKIREESRPSSLNFGLI